MIYPFKKPITNYCLIICWPHSNACERFGSFVMASGDNRSSLTFKNFHLECMKGGGGSGYFCYYYGVMLRISIDLHISLDITSSITFKFKFAFWVIEPWKSPAFDIKYSSSASSEPKKSWNAKERKWMNHFITLRERLFYFQFQFLKKCRGRWRTISIAEERIGAWRHWA